MKDDTNKLKRTVEILKLRKADGLIIYSNGSNNSSRPYLWYFSDFKPLGSNSAVIISKSGDIALLVDPSWDSIRAAEKSWIDNVIGTSDFDNALIDTLRKFKIKGAVSIVGSRDMTESTYINLAKEVTIVPADDIIGEIAQVKSEKELEIARTVGRMADAGFEVLIKRSRIGIREFELAAEIDFAMRSAGADDCFVFLRSGEHNNAIYAPTDKRLNRGSIVIAEITPILAGQAVQLCRTVVLGEPTLALTEKYKLLVRSFEASLRAIKAGVSASVISKAINKVIGDAGYGKYCYPPYMRARGHACGIGSTMGPVDLGQLFDDNEVKLQNRQIFVVHPNQYFPETGYLACGESIMVTETGVERLSETETRLYIQEV